MISVFLREQKRYTQEDLVKEFHCSEEKTVRILKRLKEYGVLKAVKANDTQKDLTDLLDEDIEIADVEVGENEYLYVFTFVGVITIEGRVLKCYPKYLLDATAPKAELKQDMTNGIIAEAFEMDRDDLKRRRTQSVRNVKATNGTISLEKYARSRQEPDWDDDEWQD